MKYLFHGIDMKAISLPGRELTWMADGESLQTEQTSLCMMRCAPGGRVRTAHRHRGVEEVLVILEGEGEAWVDGARVAFAKGDAVRFPKDSLHQVRNTGEGMLRALCVFGCADGKSTYETGDFDAFADGGTV